jgi:hypothetical protein
MQDTSGTSRKFILYNRTLYITRITTEKTFANSRPELKEKNNNTPSAEYLKGQHLRKNYSN